MIEYVNKELVSAGVSRGRKKSLQSVIDKAKAYIEADHIDLKEYRIGLECGLDKEEFRKFEEQVKASKSWGMFLPGPPSSGRNPLR